MHAGDVCPAGWLQDAARQRREEFIRQMEVLQAQSGESAESVRRLGERISSMTHDPDAEPVTFREAQVRAADVLPVMHAGDTRSAAQMFEELRSPAAQPTMGEMERLRAELYGLDLDDPGTTDQNILLRLSTGSLEMLRRIGTSVRMSEQAVDVLSTVMRRVAAAQREAAELSRSQARAAERVQTRVLTRDGFSHAQQVAIVAGMSPQEAAQALNLVIEGSWCFHPEAVCTSRATAGSGAVPYYTVRCSDCGSEASRLGTLPHLYPTRVQPEVSGWERTHYAGEQPGLGTTGRNVPGHRPESWQSGQPWDRTETPDRDEVPERGVPGGTRAAADRVYRGVW